jgi:hypothetical protein
VWGMFFTGYPCNNVCFSLIYTWYLFHWQPYHFHVPIVLQSGCLNLMEPSEPVQACNWNALAFTFSIKTECLLVFGLSS